MVDTCEFAWEKLAKSKVKYMYWWDEPNCFTCLCNL